jgi:hypothetical membrane protein
VQSGSTELKVAPVVNTDRGLLFAGAVAPALFIGAWLLGMLVSSEGLKAQASELALGRYGWMMSVVFIVAGAAFAVFGVGLYRALERRSRVGMVLLAVAGLGMVGSGIFLTDAPGARETTHGSIHNALFMVVMVALLLNMAFNGLKLRSEGWRHGFGIYTIVSAVALPILLGVFLAVGSSPGDPLYGISGVLEMALVAVPFAWVEVVALRLCRRAG